MANIRGKRFREGGKEPLVDRQEQPLFGNGGRKVPAEYPARKLPRNLLHPAILVNSGADLAIHSFAGHFALDDLIKYPGNSPPGLHQKGRVIIEYFHGGNFMGVSRAISCPFSS